MKAFVQLLNCIFIGLQALADGPIFSDITPLHLAANIDEQKKRKQKYTSLFLKHLQTDFFKFVFLRARSDLRSKTSSSRFESDC